MIEECEPGAIRAELLKGDQVPEAEERNIDEIWEDTMSDDASACAIALAQISQRAGRAVCASCANVERVVALIDGPHRGSAVDVAKQLALEHGLVLLNAGVLKAVAKLEGQVSGFFLADLLESGPEARALVFRSNYFPRRAEQLCRDYSGRSFLALARAVIRHSREARDLAEGDCSTVLEHGLGLSRSQVSEVAELACTALQEYPAWAEEFPRRGIVHNILIAAIRGGKDVGLRKALMLAVRVVKLVPGVDPHFLLLLREALQFDIEGVLFCLRALSLRVALGGKEAALCAEACAMAEGQGWDIKRAALLLAAGVVLGPSKPGEKEWAVSTLMTNACIASEPAVAHHILSAIERVAKLGGDLRALGNEELAAWVADWDLSEFGSIRAALGGGDG
jgi:hypothetical protein